MATFFFSKNNLELQRPMWETFQLDKITHLRNTRESKGSQIEPQKRMPTLIGMQASKRLQDSKIASLKDTLQNTVKS